MKKNKIPAWLKDDETVTAEAAETIKTPKTEKKEKKKKPAEKIQQSKKESNKTEKKSGKSRRPRPSRRTRLAKNKADMRAKARRPRRPRKELTPLENYFSMLTHGKFQAYKDAKEYILANLQDSENQKQAFDRTLNYFLPRDRAAAVKNTVAPEKNILRAFDENKLAMPEKIAVPKDPCAETVEEIYRKREERKAEREQNDETRSDEEHQKRKKTEMLPIETT